MRSKGSDFGGDHLGYNLNPGPGSYDDLNLEPKSGKFKVSKFTDSKLGIVNKAPRFENEKETPGPLSYSELDNLTGNGKYVLSKRKGSGTRKFDIEGRKTFTDKFREDSTKVPGPGNYEKPSDFGVYGDSKYYKTLRSEA